MLLHIISWNLIPLSTRGTSEDVKADVDSDEKKTHVRSEADIHPAQSCLPCHLSYCSRYSTCYAMYCKYDRVIVLF